MSGQRAVSTDATQAERTAGALEWNRFGALVSGRGTGAAVFVVAFALVVLLGSVYIQYECTLITIYAIISVSQEWLFGRAGLVSLGPAAIAAVGAFTTARLSTLGWAVFPVPLLVSLVFGGVVGLIVGVPGLRFRGIYLLLTTLALQFVISFAAQEYQGSGVYEAGFSVTPPHWGSLQLGGTQALLLISAMVLGLVILVLLGLYSATPGRAWEAIRQNEHAASVMGVNVVRWKLAAFVGSSALTAVAGSLFAYQSGEVEYTTFSINLSLTFVVIVFIGGLGTILGPILGAVIVVFLPVWIQELGQSLSGLPGVSAVLVSDEAFVAEAIYGFVLIIILLYERGGLVGVGKRVSTVSLRSGRRLAERVRARWGSHAGSV